MSSPAIALSPGDVDSLPPALADIEAGANYRAGTPAAGASAAEGSGAPIASVDAGDPQNVTVEDPETFRAHEAQLAAHEATHLWQNNLPPQVQAAIPPDDPAAPYDISDAAALRAQGKTLAQIPHEKAAAIVQKYVADPGSRKALQPWIDDLENTPLSTVMPTAPTAAPANEAQALWQRLKDAVSPTAINTASRAPGPPPAKALAVMADDIHNLPEENQ